MKGLLDRYAFANQKFDRSPLLSHIIVIPAKAEFLRRPHPGTFKGIRYTRFRGYDVNFFMEFDVHWLLRLIKPLSMQ
jgi:hypothetical protein